MIGVRYTLHWKHDLSEWPKGEVSKGTELANHAVGMKWVEKMLPKHFTNAALKEYGYMPRQRGYSIAKAKIERQTAPMVGISRGRHKAGQLRAQVKSAVRVRATTKSVRVTMEMPNYGVRRSRHGAGPNLPAELTTVTEAEAHELCELARGTLREYLMRDWGPSKTEKL